MILFCLPYAGGSQVIYHKWKNHLSEDIHLYPIELKGRGKRFNEPFYQSLEEAVDDIFLNIKYMIYDREYAIYGHSMGSLLAYELYYKINKMEINKPKHIFFSGYGAPHIPGKKENIHTLSNYEFINKIVEFGGTPEELLNNEKLLEIFIPILRNDFKIIETYNYKARVDKIDCDISVLNGNQDSINLENMLAWNNHTNKNFKIYDFEGNHFFINNNIENITRIINDTLVTNSKIK